MKHDKVGSVMTADVVHAVRDTPFKEVARLLARHRISGLPVVDGDDKVVGVVSETDLLARHTAPAASGPARLTRVGRRRAGKAGARTAGQLMSEPPVTVHAEDTIAEAARTMAERRVERLPVVDVEDRLVGIVTRGDLLRVFLRPDGEIRAEVVQEVLVRGLLLRPYSVDVFVTDGVVTLQGRLELRSDTEIAVAMTRRVDGVVDVVDGLTSRLDDTHTREAR
ncbi:CBS domain-containing protein [Streptomyces sp. NPDC004539]|uniref:CBS domain-containing protein n=1 Tax=Streptomyces sp. NPDC004539 TaxID=3154280 RepID=UPI0033AB960D